jgi:hypothetical protein
MSFTRRLRNIAKTQLNALKERLDRIDDEEDLDVSTKRAERDARRELEDPTDIRPVRRSPEEIARGIPTPTPRAESTGSPIVQTEENALAAHYRRLEIPAGSDLATVEGAYEKIRGLIGELGKSGGAEQQQKADELLKRYTESYETLRDALDPTAGRFDKLEL